jgi:hypothetical protein
MEVLMLEFISWLRTLATLLVMNSHCDTIYPISSLATGGAMGNALFFWVSGYCLANINDNFVKWYRKRLIRIYPSVFIVGILSAVTTVHISSIKGFVYTFIFPIRYWFIAAIIILYIPYYFIIQGKKKWNKFINMAVLVCIVIYAVIYSRLDTTVWIIENIWWFKSLYYFMIMLMAAQYRLDGTDQMERSVWCETLFVLILTAAFYGIKILCAQSPALMHGQFLQHVILFVWSQIMADVVNQIVKIIQGRNRYDTIICKLRDLGNFSLEIFLVQIWVLDVIEVINCAFPINVIIYYAATLFIAWLIHRLITYMKKVRK